MSRYLIALRAIVLRAQIRWAEKRIVMLRQAVEYHRSIAADSAEQADRLEREILVARCELATPGAL